MAEQDIAEWTPAQVADWVAGLEPPACSYAGALEARGLCGKRLLALRCDDLDRLGVRSIGHQELLLEAAELLRNYYYETKRECVARLALLASAAATALAREQAAAPQPRLDTQALADVARAVRGAVQLAGWLGAEGWRGELRARLLRLALEAATSAQRDRFAEQPARAVATAAAGIARLADYILQDTHSLELVSPGGLVQVSLCSRGRVRAPLTARLPALRTGAPPRATRDEIVQVGSAVVVGWRASAVRGACARGAARGELVLRARRRGAAPEPAGGPAGRGARGGAAQGGVDLATFKRELGLVPDVPPPPSPRASSSSESELSPPASPRAPPRLLTERPVRLEPRRRHSVSGGSPRVRRPPRVLDQLWHELARRPAPARTPYRRDKASSCTLTPPRPATCPPPPPPPPAVPPRARLDKAHSTPAYAPPALSCDPPPTIPESPADSPTIIVHTAEKADQILDFKKSSSQIEEAILRGKKMAEFTFDEPSAPPVEQSSPLQAVNAALVGVVGARPPSPRPPCERSHSPAPSPVSEYPPLRAVKREEPPGLTSPTALKPYRGGGGGISLPLRRLAGGPPRALPPLNAEPAPPAAPPTAPPTAPPAHRAPHTPAKHKTNKKMNSLLAKGRQVPMSLALPAAVWAGGAWQRVRAGRAGACWRWAARDLLLLTHPPVLLAYTHQGAPRAAAALRLPLATAAPAPEVKSRAHAWKVYHLGSCFYFASDSRAAMTAWLQQLQAAAQGGTSTLGDDSKQFSETDYSDESDDDDKERDRESHRERERDKDKDKSKFNSLKKLTTRTAEPAGAAGAGAAGAASLDRKTLRSIFARWNKDDRTVKRPTLAPAPAEHYRRAAPAPAPAPAPRAPPAPAPAPIHYIHASNPNLLDFEQELPRAPPLPRPAHRAPDSLAGFITLEQFMLSKQKEELKQVYSNRVLLGVERDRAAEEGEHADRAGEEEQSEQHDARQHQQPPAGVAGVAGVAGGEAAVTSPTAMLAELDKYWLTALRRNDRVHGAGAGSGRPQTDSASSGGASPSGMARLRNMFAKRRDEPQPHAPPAVSPAWAPQYPHLQCPPTFEPEVYSLSAPPRPQGRRPE